MATNRVMPLDDSQFYVYCDVCKANGTPNSPLVRSMNEVKCQFGHTFSGSMMMSVRPFSGDQPDTVNMDMVKTPISEQPPPTSVKTTFWLHPRVIEALKNRYPYNLIATADTVLSSLADGNVLIISGADVAKLKKRGCSNGAQIVAALEAMDGTEIENKQLRDKIARYEEVFKAAGVNG
jgi:hypothetical protein